MGGCPDARTCPHYKLLGGYWPKDSTGRVTIHYRINPDGNIHNTLSRDQAIAAIRSGVDGWADVDPTVNPVYDGTTTDKPGNGNGVIGFATDAQSPPNVIATARHTPLSADSEHKPYTGFHVFLRHTYAFTWTPCDPPNGQECSDDLNKGSDLAALVRHEFGHVVGLDDLIGSQYNELTMFGGTGGNRRSMFTLGLGDVLGVRSLYPTSAPMPTIYRP